MGPMFYLVQSHGALRPISAVLLADWPHEFQPWPCYSGAGDGATHRGSLGAVEHPELNPGSVDGPAHDTIEGIHLAHQLTFGEAADGRVARHLPDCFDCVCK